MYEDVSTSLGRRDEAVTFGAGEALADPGEDGTLSCPRRPVGGQNAPMIKLNKKMTNGTEQLVEL